MSNNGYYETDKEVSITEDVTIEPDVYELGYGVVLFLWTGIVSHIALILFILFLFARWT